MAKIEYTYMHTHSMIGNSALDKQAPMYMYMFHISNVAASFYMNFCMQLVSWASVHACRLKLQAKKCPCVLIRDI